MNDQNPQPDIFYKLRKSARVTAALYAGMQLELFTPLKDGPLTQYTSWRFWILDYPNWLRWLGVITLAAGITLLGLAHYHLGKSFHSLVVSKEEHQLVTSDPYRWIRHPIYTAYLMNYVGGGLLASNLVLTFVPVFFGLMIINRIPREEAVMQEEFGQDYINLESRTGRLLPPIKKNFDNIQLDEEKK